MYTRANMLPPIKAPELGFIKFPKIIFPVFDPSFIKFIKVVVHLVKVGNVDIDIILINPFFDPN